MIRTVTLNPAFDITITVEKFKYGIINNILDKKRRLGGKGINVSKMLNILNIPNIAYIIAGEKNIEELEKEIERLNLNSKIILNRNHYTRENIKIINNKTKKVTEINEKGFVENETINMFLDMFINDISSGDILVLSGSLPEGLEKDFYAKLIRIAKSKKAYVILDTSGEPFELAIKEKPNLVKPNENELKEILFKDLDKNIKYLLNNDIEVLLSLGEKGFKYFSKEKEYNINSINVDVKTTVGAGDSLLAGFISKHNIEDKLIFARACATARVSKGDEIKIEDINKFLNEIGGIICQRIQKEHYY